MKFVFKKKIFDKIVDTVAAAEADCRTISKIELSRLELFKLTREEPFIFGKSYNSYREVPLGYFATIVGVPLEVVR